MDLRKPLLTGCRFKIRTLRVQYEGLHLICFHYGRYGHTEAACLLKREDEPSVNAPSIAPPSSSVLVASMPETPPNVNYSPSGYWMIAELPRHRTDQSTRQSGGR